MTETAPDLREHEGSIPSFRYRLLIDYGNSNGVGLLSVLFRGKFSGRLDAQGCYNSDVECALGLSVVPVRLSFPVLSHG